VSLTGPAERMTEKKTDKGQGNEHASEQNQAELAHSVIESLLEHTRVVSDLIALMAQALDQDTTKALTLTPQWQAYLESRSQLEHTREDIEKFTEMMKQIGEH